MHVLRKARRIARPFIAIALTLLCCCAFAEQTQRRHDPVARWVNEQSHEVMQGTLALMLLVGDYETVDSAAVTFEGMVLSLGVAEGLKLVVNQPRPRDPNAEDGFPSSHAATAFAFARGLSDWRSDWSPCVYAFAAGVGWARVEEGYHTTEQVLAGAALGLWIAGISLQSDGLVMRRGSDTDSAMLLGPGDSEAASAFGAGPSVVLWKQRW